MPGERRPPGTEATRYGRRLRAAPPRGTPRRHIPDMADGASLSEPSPAVRASLESELRQRASVLERENAVLRQSLLTLEGMCSTLGSAMRADHVQLVSLCRAVCDPTHDNRDAMRDSQRHAALYLVRMPNARARPAALTLLNSPVTPAVLPRAGGGSAPRPRG